MRQLSNLIHERGGMEKGQQRRIVRLKEVEDGLPDLDGEHGGIQRVEGGLGCILGRGRGNSDGLSGAMSLRAIPVTIAILPIPHRSDVPFRGACPHPKGRRRIDAFTAGGFAGAASGIDTGIDTFDLAATAAGAGDAGSHVGGKIRARETGGPSLQSIETRVPNGESSRRRLGGG